VKLEFDPNALEDLRYWSKKDGAKARKILRLLDEISRTPFAGMGKPEPLKHALSGCWSRRIDREHRLVYRVEKETVHVLSCRYHY
jgi:toxin YoeB